MNLQRMFSRPDRPMVARPQADFVDRCVPVMLAIAAMMVSAAGLPAQDGPRERSPADPNAAARDNTGVERDGGSSAAPASGGKASEGRGGNSEGRGENAEDRHGNAEDRGGSGVGPEGRRDDRDDRDDREADGEEIRYWVSQLSSDQYLRRRRAVRQLVRRGPSAVPLVVDKIGSGDLEFTRLAVEVLQEIAHTESPHADGGAWGALQELAASGVGSHASRAISAVEEILTYRGEIARERLAARGVYIGMAEFVVRATSDFRPIVQIGEGWDGDLETLHWLRWVSGVRHARLVGDAVRPEVVDRLVRMPELETIAILDGKVGPDLFRSLAAMERIQNLEFRYSPVKAEWADAILDLPIRASLSLMGTGIPAQKVDEMRAARPGLQIEFRQGGFLGVTCPPDFQVCQITGVVPGSAAEQAGLIPNDIIVGIGEQKITRFKDLQDAINQHLPGDDLQIRYSRGGVVRETTATLGRMQEQVRGLPRR